MSKPFALAVALFALPLVYAPVGAAADCPTVELRADRELGERLDRIVEAAVADGFAGGVALMRDGVLVYERVAGFSDKKSKVPVTAETLFHVASITKYLTAIAVLKAAEAGRFELTDPVGKLAPGTGLAERGVTFLDLLAHRSGLGSSYVTEREADGAKALAKIDAQPIDAEKVGKFKYSNDGYDLLAILLERSYGRSYESVARSEVLTPACLERPRFWAEVELTDPGRVGQPLEKISARLRKRNYGMLGSNGLLVTAADLALLEHAVSTGRVLSKSSIAELATPRGEVSIGQVALGAFVSEHPTLGRVHSALGYEEWGDNAILNHYLDRGLILAVVTSKGPAETAGPPDPFRDRIAEAVEAVLSYPSASTSSIGSSKVRPTPGQ